MIASAFQQSNTFLSDAEPLSKQSLVKINASDGRRNSMGSGVMISPYHILTACHVVCDERTGRVKNNIKVRHLTKRKNSKAKVLGYDVYGDIAIIQLDKPFPGPYLSVAKVESSSNSAVYMADIHSFRKGKPKTKDGYVMSLNPRCRCCQSPHKYYRFQLGARPGNSGSGILNSKGEIVSITSIAEVNWSNKGHMSLNGINYGPSTARINAMVRKYVPAQYLKRSQHSDYALAA